MVGPRLSSSFGDFGKAGVFGRAARGEGGAAGEGRGWEGIEGAEGGGKWRMREGRREGDNKPHLSSVSRHSSKMGKKVVKKLATSK